MRRVAGWARSCVSPERALLTASVVLVVAGLGTTLAGWYGASRTVVVAEQLPYLISGGLLGVALVFIGSLAYVAHGQGRAIRDARAREDAIEERHRAHLARLEQRGG
jgi:hypothetical protein